MSDATWRAGATAVVRVTLADGEPQRTKQISRRFTVGARAGNCYHEDVGHATATGRDREEALGAAKAAAVKDGKRRGRGVASSTPSSRRLRGGRHRFPSQADAALLRRPRGGAIPVTAAPRAAPAAPRARARVAAAAAASPPPARVAAGGAVAARGGRGRGLGRPPARPPAAARGAAGAVGPNLARVAPAPPQTAPPAPRPRRRRAGPPRRRRRRARRRARGRRGRPAPARAGRRRRPRAAPRGAPRPPPAARATATGSSPPRPQAQRPPPVVGPSPRGRGPPWSRRRAAARRELLRRRARAGHPVARARVAQAPRVPSLPAPGMASPSLAAYPNPHAKPWRKKKKKKNGRRDWTRRSVKLHLPCGQKVAYG